jgi:hypothetical protein
MDVHDQQRSDHLAWRGMLIVSMVVLASVHYCASFLKSELFAGRQVAVRRYLFFRFDW